VPLLRHRFPPIGDKECKSFTGYPVLSVSHNLCLCFLLTLGVFEGNFHLEGKAECVESVLTAAVVHEICLVAACMTINEPFVLFNLHKLYLLVSCYSFHSIIFL
jgi:hypothetical protein